MVDMRSTISLSLSLLLVFVVLLFLTSFILFPPKFKVPPYITRSITFLDSR